MSSPAIRRAVAAYDTRLKASGVVKVTFRADPDMQADMSRHIARHGTLQAAIRHLLALDANSS